MAIAPTYHQSVLEAERNTVLTSAQVAKLQAEPEDEDYHVLVPNYGCDDEGYLISDGLPMAGYDPQRQNMTNTIGAIDGQFPGDIYVSGNNFVHYQKGDDTKYISPDCYVVFGVTKEMRDNYKSWENGDRMPAIVFEFTSRRTWREDTESKKDIYQDLIRVPEYILFDPIGEYLDPRLRGFRLNARGVYEAITIVDGRMYSEQLDLYLVPQGPFLRLFDEKTGEFLRNREESEAERIAALHLAEAEQNRADAEQGRADANQRRADIEQRRADAEAQTRLLAQERAELAQKRADTEQERANIESQMRLAMQQRADIEAQGRLAEKRRADETEAELAQLRAEVEALKQQRNGTPQAHFPRALRH